MIRVFIGYDPHEAAAFHVLSHAIMVRASAPVSIVGLTLNSLGNIFHREYDKKQSTNFSFTRFLVPYLCDFTGHAIFMDCDMLCRGDIAELWRYRSASHAVRVVKHEYEPSTQTKFLGHEQTQYPLKNWSSVMVFNCRQCTNLTPEYVSHASGLDLHQFKWLTDGPYRVGALPSEWNYLVGEDTRDKAEDPKLVHYTLGGPYFKESRDCEYAEEWFNEKGRALFSG